MPASSTKNVQTGVKTIRSLERERKRPLRSGEGPVGVVLCPSRELARQTHEVVSFFMDRLDRTPLRSTCAIGGEPKQQQLDVVRRRGVHAVVATPGRFRDFLDSRAINLPVTLRVKLPMPNPADG